MRHVHAVLTAPRRRRPAGRPALALASVTTGLIGLLLTSGCSATGGTSAGAAPAGSITVVAVPGVDNAPLFLAKHNGLFASAGVNVTIDRVSSVTDELRALANGRANVAAGDYAGIFFAQASTRNLRIVADGYDASPGVIEVLALPASKITSPQQLQGKIIGSPNTENIAASPGTPNSLATAATTSVLQSFGVAPATFTFKAMTPQREIDALAAGKVSAILLTQPYIYQAEAKLGAVEVLDSCSGATSGLPLSGYFALNNWSRQNSALLAKFRSALERAQAQAALPGPVQNALPGYVRGITTQQAALVTIGTYPTATNPNDLQRVAQLMSTEGMTRTAVSVASMIIP